MCTVSILRQPDGYTLWFNRDELDTRAPELGPVRGGDASGVSYAYPIDGQRGGTWLLLNSAGLCACILNDYRAQIGAGSVSRGEIPFWCASAFTAEDAVHAIQSVERQETLRRMGPFRLILVDAQGGGCLAHWEGRSFRVTPAPEFLTSSSREPMRIENAREDAHRALMQRDAEALEELHWRHDPQCGAESVRMRRSDARTRSITRVEVRAHRAATLEYTPVDWETGARAAVSLELLA